MSDIVATAEWGGGYYVEVDSWGGWHIHYPEDRDEDGPPLSLSPAFVDEILAAHAEEHGNGGTDAE